MDLFLLPWPLYERTAWVFLFCFVTTKKSQLQFGEALVCLMGHLAACWEWERWTKSHHKNVVFTHEIRKVILNIVLERSHHAGKIPPIVWDFLVPSLFDVLIKQYLTTWHCNL